MIPLRVKVEGFLSYKDEASLDFDGASLWMLTGANGAGKSAIFDAVTFALYSAHRGGKQNADKLINQGCDKFTVEFEFRLGEDVYRARRIVSKRGASTRQIDHLAGPNPPPRGTGTTAMEPGTDTQAGFDEWVKTHIGLSYEAFKASALLRQGESDALLKMDSKERHELLTQLVDLSRYVRLYEKAKARLDDYTHEEKWKADQLLTRPDIPPQAIANLAEASAAHLKVSEEAQAELQRIAGLKVHAEHWRSNKARLVKIEAELVSARSILADAPEIERAVQRRNELDKALPILDSLLDARRRQANAKDSLMKNQDKLNQLTHKKQTFESEYDQYTKELGSLRIVHATANSDIQRHQTRQNELAPHQGQLQRLADVKEQVARLDVDLAAFPDDLDPQADKANREVEYLNNLKALQGDLRQIYESRKEESDAAKKIETIESQRVKLDEQAKSLAGEEKALRTRATQAEKAQTKAQKALAQSEVELKSVEERLSNLGTLGRATVCTYCGQPLTAEHLQKERRTLTEALNEAKATHKIAQKADVDAETNAAEIAGLISEWEKRNRTNTRKIDANSEVLTGQQTALQATSKRRQAALKRLPKEWHSRVEEGYPTTSDLQKLETEIIGLASAKARQKRLSDKVNERNSKVAERKPLAKELAKLAATYPPEQAQVIEAELKTLVQIIQALQGDLKKQALTLKTLDDKVKDVEQRKQEIGVALSETEKAQTTARAFLTQATDDEQGAIAQAEQIALGAITKLNEAQVYTLHTERAQVQAVAQKLEQLQTAQQAEVHLRREQEDLIAEITKVPLEAQHTPEHFETLTQSAQTRQEQADRARRDADGERLKLEANKAEREQIEQEHLKAARLAKRYKTLSTVLGRDGLQRHLLEQVERAIIENANAVLDKISGGTLWLDLQSGETGATKTKALDLVAYNRTNGATGIGVEYLSGSQRFRTAVSLALGIGQYASQNSHRVEAVIIDEGFGSLDKKGRDEMIDELRNLKDTLSRIIVVSHQEEFTQAFPSNRYRVSLNEGNSTVQLEVDS